MSLVWTLIAGFLYLEICIVLLLVLPVANPSRWQKFFKSRFLAMIGKQAQAYFFLLLGVLVLFLLEAIREMRKYSHPEAGADHHINTEMQHSMRLFRAQRNFYISGFSIFLTLVIRRLITLISAQAALLAQSEASMKQAKSATIAARSLLDNQKINKENVDQKEVDGLKLELENLKAELIKERKDKEALKSQAESVNKEYDRLAEECRTLQNKLSHSSGDKKE